ncbi:hypothetical protein ELI30_08880 [Rhizobium leguminosarum]|uniref:hypothetical protein n=1 Tax=Rhizobium leguminosarum TaxID=384 RepID=UPI00102F3E3D|nr:hypothetical protein [Rhizobium leguminosarum]TAV48407.1 hypothetical protein ELI32_09335 [Rhizobium leguminosarum]TAV57907.1 hypothetical protein ELI31_08865 [Rhizobium leguminosarum]TAV68847.1 hypothetical protein ELI30_08880 [Rhizobium leguminosarum]
MSDIQARLADINRRAAPVLEENSRLHAAAGKAITLVLTVAAFGVLTFIAIAPTEQSLKAKAVDCQEACVTWQK